MTDQRDPKLSRRYRELGAEEPSRELDQAILSAAHRAADRPHAPLVTPAGRHRWYFAFGAAAILVLAVAVTVQVERQQPDPEALPSSPAPARSDRAEGFLYRQGQEKDSKRAEVAKQVEPPRPFADAASPAPEARRAPAKEASPTASPPAEVKPQPSVEAQSQTGTAPAPSAKQESADNSGQRQRDLSEANRVEVQPKPSAAPAQAPERRERAAAAAPQAAPSADVMASAAQASPERLLQRIAELRKQGLHDEADKLLVAFRQLYPDYRISEEVRKSVERPRQ